MQLITLKDCKENRFVHLFTLIIPITNHLIIITSTYKMLSYRR